MTFSYKFLEFILVQLRYISGAGRTATVWRGLDTMTGQIVAVKVVHDVIDDMYRVRREATILTEMRRVPSTENM